MKILFVGLISNSFDFCQKKCSYPWVLANDPTSFTILRFFAGAFGHASVIVSYVYVMEFLGPRGRSWLGCQHLQMFAAGYISLSLIGYIWRDWHYMQLAITGPWWFTRLVYTLKIQLLYAYFIMTKSIGYRLRWNSAKNSLIVTRKRL